MKWSTQKKLTGFIFVLPWIIGFLLFTLYPLIETIRYSFSDVRVQVGGVAMTGVGWKNYVQVLMGDTAFLTELPGYLQQIFLYVPMTLVFSVPPSQSRFCRQKAVSRTVFSAGDSDERSLDHQYQNIGRR